MAENFEYTPGTGGTGAADDIAGVKYQKIKLVDGTEDSTTVIGAGVGVAANALRVALATSSEIIANLSATDNAVLDAIQTAIEACQTALEATLTISGTVELGATDNAVLDAIQTATEAVQTAVEGTLTVDGTVTANLGATDNAVLDAIQAAVETLDNAISGTEMQVDVVGVLPAGTNNIGDVDVASIAAGENHLGEVGLPDDTITITCSLDTSAYADGDVLFDTQEIAGAVRNNGDTAILQTIHVVDIDDQGVDFDLIFFNANTSLGTENAAPDIDDTEVLTTVGSWTFVNDYIDLGANQVRTDAGIGLEMETGSGTTSLYVAGITRGAPTHSASGLQITFGFLRN